ncbi:hypothetical protein P8452_05654 [Trifolium repens]|nr:hypothetical protein P8452_05654 [Trifolium repens]
MRVFASQFLCCIRPFVLCSTTISLRPLDWPKSPTMRAAISDVIIYPLPFGIFQQSGYTCRACPLCLGQWRLSTGRWHFFTVFQFEQLLPLEPDDANKSRG